MFVVISRWILRRMRNVLDKSCRENENTFYVFRENLAVCEIMWKNIVEQDMPHMITWISKARKRTYTQDIATATMVTRMRLVYLVPVFPLLFFISSLWLQVSHWSVALYSPDPLLHMVVIAVRLKPTSPCNVIIVALLH